MALSVGELEATLRLKDQLTAEFSAAMSKVIGRMGEVQDVTKKVNATSSDLIGTLGKVAGAFGIAWSITAAMRFLNTVSEEAKALSILSLQTRINVEDLQVLSAATKDYGVEGEQLGRALFQLSQRIAGGDAGVARAYHLMGLSIEEVKGKNALDLFLTTERGLRTLQGSIQDSAATDLYGGRLGASMVAFASDSDNAVAKARAWNTAVGGEGVKAAAEYSEAIERATRTLHAWTMEIEGGVALGFNVLNDAVEKGASKWSIFVAMVQDWATSSTVTGASTTHLADLLDKLNRSQTKDIELIAESVKGHEKAAVALDAHGQAAQFMAALELDSSKPLLAWQVEYLEHLDEIGQLTSNNATALGVNIDQFAKYKDSIEKAKQAADKLAESVKKQLELENKMLVDTEKLWGDYYLLKISQGGTATDLQIAQIQQVANEQELAARRAGISDKSYYTALATVTKATLDGVRVDWAALGAEAKQTLQDIADKAQATYLEALKHVGEWRDETIQKYRDAADAAQLAADSWGQATVDNAIKATDAIDGVRNAVERLGETYNFVLNNYARAPSNLITATSLVRPDTQSQIFAGLPGGNVSHLVQPLISTGVNIDPGVAGLPGFASGVSNFAGGTAWVGERGPELLTLPHGASVTPAATISPSIAITINGSVLSNDQQIARVVGDAITRSLRTSGVRLPSGT